MKKQLVKIFVFCVCISNANYVFAGGHEGGGSGGGQAASVVDKSRFLLSTMREGGFSHVGGAEAIVLLLDKVIAANAEVLNGNILEIGSSYGGTANFLKSQHYEKVQGIDIDEEAVKYAHEKYPNIEFKVADATKLTGIFEDDYFNFIYMFDVAHAIEDKLSLLQRIKAVSKKNSLLAIIDYSLKGTDETEKLTDNKGLVIYALNLKKLIPLMRYIGLEIVEVVDVTDSYKAWYSSIIERINLSKEDLLSKGYSEEEIKFIQDKFNFLLTMINEDKIGGTIIIARKL